MRPSFRVQQARYLCRHSPAVVPVARCRACLSQCGAANCSVYLFGQGFADGFACQAVLPLD